MILREQPPQLAEDRGHIWSHNTGGEHATKFVGQTVNEFNRLRQHLDPVPDEISQDELHELMYGDDQEVVFGNIVPPENNGVGPVVAGSIAVRSITPEDFEYRVTMAEMVVSPELRLQGIASWLMGRSLELIAYDPRIQPTELVVDTSVFSIDDEFRDKLHEFGFRHELEHGSPALWLPGNTLQPRFDWDDPATKPEIEEILEKMPDNWNGYLPFSVEQDGKTRIYRDGQVVGSYKRIPDSQEFSEERNGFVSDYLVFDAEGSETDKLEAKGRKEAAIHILNKL